MLIVMSICSTRSVAHELRAGCVDLSYRPAESMRSNRVDCLQRSSSELMSSCARLERSGYLCEQIATDSCRLPAPGDVVSAKDDFVRKMDTYLRQLGECCLEVFDGVRCVDWSDRLDSIGRLIGGARDYYLGLGDDVIGEASVAQLDRYIAEIKYCVGAQADRYQGVSERLDSSVQLLEHDVRHHEEPYTDDYSRIQGSHNSAQRLQDIDRALELCAQDGAKRLSHLAEWFA